ncbi:sterile alpha motif domain-containing protein 1 isoform X2 [Galleria mellonella]|uniref:Sterile alpha motif domain-containing protein 1 isoform X2 n=1 Tax=Galleria mellonella TaxID=7137 RepID=A0ABM3ME72_GALME|nr:sterile alpha motif domain-containing protein 1 isoform X2 [Galleria mellonella]
MVTKTKPGINVNNLEGVKAGARSQDVIIVKSSLRVAAPGQRDVADCRRTREAEADDVINLGAPRPPRLLRSDASPRARTARTYTPNPRLYPGPSPKTKLKAERSEGHGRRRKRTFRRPVPKARLYRAAPPRAAAPTAVRQHWPPPAPPGPRVLDTACRAALRLGERRRLASPASPAPPLPAPPPVLSAPRRLVVTLPAATARAMDARPPCSPDEGSDGNDAASAPSEFLAEFLSAIMQRQYAEALKYCRLILQYEPHNTTARGFYPLLQHKVNAHKRADEPRPRRGSSSGDSSAGSRRRALASRHEVMEQEADEAEAARTASESEGEGGSDTEASCASQSSLELDSSPSLSISRRTDHTDSACASGSGSGSMSGSGSGWESTGTAGSADGGGGGSGSGGERPAPADDNGNAPPPCCRHSSPVCLQIDDLENDNNDTTHYKRSLVAGGGGSGSGGGGGDDRGRVAAAAARPVRLLHQVSGEPPLALVVSLCHCTLFSLAHLSFISCSCSIITASHLQPLATTTTRRRWLSRPLLPRRIFLFINRSYTGLIRRINRSCYVECWIMNNFPLAYLRLFSKRDLTP